MHNIQSIYRDCYNKIVDLGITPGNIVGVSINPRYSRCYGKCITTCKRNRTTGEVLEIWHKIEIAGFLMHDNVELSCLENTMMHEILHTCQGCQNHGKNWKYYADMVNRAYNQHVSTYVTREEMKYAPEKKKPTQDKWSVVCQDCGKTWGFARKKTYFDYINLCSCPKCKTHNLKLNKNY